MKNERKGWTKFEAQSVGCLFEFVVWLLRFLLMVRVNVSLSPSVFHIHTLIHFSVCGTRGEPVTFGSLGMVLIMWLEAAIRLKVICQEVQTPDWTGPVGIV